MDAVALRCHASTPAPIVRRITGRVDPNAGALIFTYALDGIIDQIALPPEGVCRRADGLWEHTCFEAFVAADDAPGYCELNFSPACAWAAYAFSEYRIRAPLPDDVAAPVIAIRHSAERLELTAVVQLRPLLRGAMRLRVALAAVIEDASGSLSYWALHHPPGKPDFHHPSSFVLPVVLPA